jgi:hypothetical protein
MDSLFGGEMNGAVRFVIAFVVVLALIGISAWLVRRFGRGALSSAAARSRQPRLAVIDAASVDARRRLILVRRDNVEHLVMIGGPTDIVVEQNIVRAVPATARDYGAGRIAPVVPDTMLRPAPLEDSSQWPLQPQPEPSLRGQRAVAEPPMHEPALHEPSLPEPPLHEPPLHAPAAREPAPVPQARQPDGLAGLADAVAAHSPPPGESQHAAESHLAPSPAPAAPQTATPQNDRNLAEMAQRLEAVLRRPGAGEPRPDVPASESNPAPRQGAEPSPPRGPDTLGEHRPGQNKNFYESLEQEMASLLGRPTGKT